MIAKVIILSLLVTYTLSSPLPKNKYSDNEHRVLYDQRQEGEWNVRADLQNFIIMIIPTSTNSSPTPSLLDFLRTSPGRSHMKRIKNVHQVQHHPHQQQEQVKSKADPETQETMHFIESKSAPYHVDLTKSRSHLSQLHPEPVVNNEEIVIANSPSLSLVKTASEALKNARNGRAYILSLPSDDFVLTRTEENKKVVKKDGKKKTIKESAKESKHGLKLLGAENEQCGPGRARDSYGICRSIPK